MRCKNRRYLHDKSFFPIKLIRKIVMTSNESKTKKKKKISIRMKLYQINFSIEPTFLFIECSSFIDLRLQAHWRCKTKKNN